VGTNQLLPTINQVVKGSAAQSAGILAGDEVLSINGKQVDNWYTDVQIIRNSNGAPLTLLIKRGTEEITISASAKLETIDGTERYVLGIINDVGIKRSDLATAAKNSAIVTKDFLVQSVKSLIKLPSKIPALWGQTVSGETRDPNGLVGVVGVARVSGQAVGSDALSITERLSTFI
jgi:membrane-associated protease RseP (regulator of RpoE activity)